MTFSDAEDDQPSRGQSDESADQSSNNQNAPQPPANNVPGSDGSNSSAESANRPNALDPGSNGATNFRNAVLRNSLSSESSTESSNSPVFSAGESGNTVDNNAVGPTPRSAPEQVMDAAQAVILEADQDTSKSLSSERVLQKLQQIQSYLHQTTAAMQNLEQEGNLSKIAQYNTLAKVVRDLKSSQLKLISHLTKLKAKENEDRMVNSGEQESEHGTESRSGSELVGVVGDLPALPGDTRRDDESHDRPSMAQELVRHQGEQQELASRLRTSLARRQDLMARYESTRERLSNLKEQRDKIAQEERRLLHEAGAPEDPYEDPVPGAEHWTLDQIRSSLENFEGLKLKVDRLEGAYKVKKEHLEESDEQGLADVTAKLQQLQIKRSQVNNGLNKLRAIARAKLNGEEIPKTCITNPTNDSLTNTTKSPPTTTTTVSTTGAANSGVQAVSTVPSTVSALPSALVAERPTGESGDETASALLLRGRETELESRQKYLSSLEGQLGTMKMLLATHSEKMNQWDENGGIPDDEDGQEEGSQHPGTESDGLTEAQALIPESAIVGVGGDVITLTEDERRDPLVVEKYKQLTDAKGRLSKMESVMNAIAEASHSGRRLVDALSPDSMKLLQDARQEFGEADDEEECPTEAPPPVTSSTPDGETVLAPTSDLSSAKNKLNELRQLLELVNQASASGLNIDDVLTKEQLELIEGDDEPPSQRSIYEQQILSEQQDNLNRHSSNSQADSEPERGRNSRANQASREQLNVANFSDAPTAPLGNAANLQQYNVNEGAREKVPTRKHTNSALFGAISDCDPRVQEVMTLQEELKEKKNALEALMRQMGKENSIDTGSNVDVEEEGPGVIAWGRHVQASEQYGSNEDMVANSRHQHREYHSQLPLRSEPLPPGQKPQNRSAGGLVTVNNLSVRPKNNGFQTSEENEATFAPPQVPPAKSPNTSAGVQNQFSSAMLQLNQVQESINNLCETLKLTKSEDPYSSGYNTNMNNPNMCNQQRQPNVNNVYPQVNQFDPNLNVSPVNEQNMLINSEGSARGNMMGMSHLGHTPTTVNNLHGAMPHVPSSMNNLTQSAASIPNNMVHGPAVSNMSHAAGHATMNNIVPGPFCPVRGVLPQQNYNVSPVPQMHGQYPSQQMMNDQGSANPLMTGLQQCFSQLQLQSMEIQALSKGMQVRPQINAPLSSSYPLVPSSASPMPTMPNIPTAYPPISTPFSSAQNYFPPTSNVGQNPVYYPYMPQYPPPPP